MFTVYLIKVFGVETLAFALVLIKCCWVAKMFRETLLQKINAFLKNLVALVLKFEIASFSEHKNKN